MKNYFVYIVTNKYRGTLYIGVTGNLERRLIEHQKSEYKGFSKKYNLKRLVYFEDSASINDAIAREKQLKNWRRQWKINLIEFTNPQWKDLSLETIDAETSSV